jgi:tRNA pseudouridine38-40 synthase
MRYKVVCNFLGYNFLGWQIQPKGRTIQATANRACSIICKTPTKAIGCSRTDSKVSAKAYVFHFDSTINVPGNKLVNAFNAVLPEDIRVSEVTQVDDEFHSRYGVKRKEYKYTIETGAYNVFEHQYVLQLNRKLDLKKMQRTAEIFIGVHDFTSFNVSRLAIIPNQVRKIDKFSVTQEGTKIIIQVEGRSFLQHMIRMIAQTLIEVGLSRIEHDEVVWMLEARDKTACRFNALAEGLSLERVWYND